MPCRISNDVHERINAVATVPTFHSVNLQDGERSVKHRWEEKTPWSFTAACSWHTLFHAECSWERRRHSFGNDWAFMEHQPWNGVCLTRRSPARTRASGQFRWGARPWKRYPRYPKVNSTGTETRWRVERQKLAWWDPRQQGVPRRKSGLTILYNLLVGGKGDRKITPGVTELSQARVHIDPAACFLDVGSSYPGHAAMAKGGAVRPLKGNVSWV